RPERRVRPSRELVAEPRRQGPSERPRQIAAPPVLQREDPVTDRRLRAVVAERDRGLEGGRIAAALRAALPVRDRGRDRGGATTAARSGRTEREAMLVATQTVPGVRRAAQGAQRREHGVGELAREVVEEAHAAETARRRRGCGGPRDSPTPSPRPRALPGSAAGSRGACGARAAAG